MDSQWDRLTKSAVSSEREESDSSLTVLHWNSHLPEGLPRSSNTHLERKNGKRGAANKSLLSQLRWDSLGYILLCFFFFLLLDFHNPEEDPRFKDSSPSVSHIPTRWWAHRRRSTEFREMQGRRRTDNSEVQIRTICPSVGNNSIVTYRTMSLPDTDRKSRRPPIHWSMPHACEGWKTRARRGEAGHRPVHLPNIFGCNYSQWLLVGVMLGTCHQNLLSQIKTFCGNMAGILLINIKATATVYTYFFY